MPVPVPTPPPVPVFALPEAAANSFGFDLGGLFAALDGNLASLSLDDNVVLPALGIGLAGGLLILTGGQSEEDAMKEMGVAFTATTGMTPTMRDALDAKLKKGSFKYRFVDPLVNPVIELVEDRLAEAKAAAANAEAAAAKAKATAAKAKAEKVAAITRAKRIGEGRLVPLPVVNFIAVPNPLAARRIPLFTAIEGTGVVTFTAETGLLSGAEEAGVFSTLESLGAFSLIESTLPLVENLRLLSLFESLLEVEAGLLFALSIALLAGFPALVALQVGSFVPIPSDGGLVAAEAGFGLLSLTGGLTLFATAFAISKLQLAADTID